MGGQLATLVFLLAPQLLLYGSCGCMGEMTLLELMTAGEELLLSWPANILALQTLQ